MYMLVLEKKTDSFIWCEQTIAQTNVRTLQAKPIQSNIRLFIWYTCPGIHWFIFIIMIVIIYKFMCHIVCMVFFFFSLSLSSVCTFSVLDRLTRHSLHQNFTSDYYSWLRCSRTNIDKFIWVFVCEWNVDRDAISHRLLCVCVRVRVSIMYHTFFQRKWTSIYDRFRYFPTIFGVEVTKSKRKCE